MLTEMLRSPFAIAEEPHPTKRKLVLEYRPQGANRFALSVRLEDDHVVGWDGAV